MFDDIIDAFTDKGGTRGEAVEVTPTPAGRACNEDNKTWLLLCLMAAMSFRPHYLISDRSFLAR